MEKLKGMTAKFMARTEAAVIIVNVVLFLIVAVVNPSAFLTSENLIDVLRNTSYAFIVAAPLTLLHMSAGSDMTIGSVTSFGGLFCAFLITSLNCPWPLAILLACVASAAFGAMKSFFTVTVGLGDYICTLGLKYALDGAVLVWCKGNPIVGFPDSFKVLGQSGIGGIYWSIIFALIFGIVFHILLTKTKFGRSACAVGGNTETARLAGINVKKIRYAANILVSIAAGFAGCIYAARYNSAQATVGTGNEMTIMASCIIGGASLGGGSGSMFGTFLGCFMLALVRNGLVLIHVSSYWQNLVFGLVLVLSLYIDLVRRNKSAGGLH